MTKLTHFSEITWKRKWIMRKRLEGYVSVYLTFKCLCMKRRLYNFFWTTKAITSFASSESCYKCLQMKEEWQHYTSPQKYLFFLKINFISWCQICFVEQKYLQGLAKWRINKEDLIWKIILKAAVNGEKIVYHLTSNLLEFLILPRQGFIC